MQELRQLSRGNLEMPAFSKKVPIPGKSSQELYETLSREIERFVQKATGGSKYEISRDEGAKRFEIKSALFSGSVSCAEGEMQMDLKLSLLAAAFKGKLDEGIEKWVNKTFPKA